MSPSAQEWFKECVRRGVASPVAYFGTEVIESWANHWKHEMTAAELEAMMDFAVRFPEAALHRWSLLAGPRPYILDPSVFGEVAKNPKFSASDVLERQNLKIRNASS